MNDWSFIKKVVMSPKIIDKDERRSAILLAAINVFAAKGYGATRIEDVALEAGIAKGTIYLYFRSRDELLLAAFEVFQKRLFSELRSIVDSEAPALARLRSLVRQALESVAGQPELARVVLDFWAAATFEARDGIPIDFAPVYAEYRMLVGKLIEEAKHEGTVRQDVSTDLPAVIIGAIEGVSLQWIMDPANLSLKHGAEAILDTMIDGLTPRASS